MTLLNVTFIRATIQLQTLIHQQGPNVQSMDNKFPEKCYKFCASSDGEACRTSNLKYLPLVVMHLCQQ
jgi:hypothetical protein